MQAFGLIVVDKPEGPSSHNIVSAVRRGTGVRKVGHAGTLDPRASGVLVLCLGPATRLSEYLSSSTKSYRATVRFGESTRTYDGEGEPTRSTGESPTGEEIETALEAFRGEIQQVPPPFSAVRVKGKKAYQLARQGKPVALDARPVTFYRLDMLSYVPPELVLDIECSAGTYIRSLAHDLGETLSTGAHLSALRRSRAGPFDLEDAVSFDYLQQAIETGTWERHLIPAVDALPSLPIVQVEPGETERIRNGLSIPAGGEAIDLARAVDPEGELVAILEADEGGTAWHPHKVFVY